MVYRNPTPTTDVVVIEDGQVLLVRRGREPYKGRLALPGGYIEYGETVEDAAVREVSEETSLCIELVEILGVYSDPSRNPRHHTLTVAFIGRRVSGEAQAGDDAADTVWCPLDSPVLNDLAFDHSLIVSDARRWLRSHRTFWSTLQRD